MHALTQRRDFGAQQDDPILIQRDGPVCRIVLNRPEARNPLGGDMVERLDQALREASETHAVRVIVFGANGPAFSAGGNLGNIADRFAARLDEAGNDPIAVNNRRYGLFLERLAATPKITIAVAQGAAMGGGAGLVCAADLAIGVQGARFGFPEVSIGLVPAQILPFVAARIGRQQARRLMLTGERIDAMQAHRIGLIDEVARDLAECEATVDALVARCADAAPGAVAATKAMMRDLFGQAQWHRQELARYLDDASKVFAAQMRTEAIEGVRAAKERRKPDWDAHGAAAQPAGTA